MKEAPTLKELLSNRKENHATSITRLLFLPKTIKIYSKARCLNYQKNC